MKSTKKATCALRRVLLLILILSLALTGCGQADESSNGEVNLMESPRDLCSYSYYNSKVYNDDKGIFDINDVRLIFYFGEVEYFLGCNFYGREPRRYINYDVVLVNTDTNNEIIVKTIEDYNTSPEYKCRVYDFDCRKVRYAHSEVIKIPSSLFESESGTIRFMIRGRDEDPNYSSDNINPIIASTRFDYKIVDFSKVEIN